MTPTSESEGIFNDDDDDSDEEELSILERIHSARRRKYVITVFTLLVLFADRFSSILVNEMRRLLPRYVHSSITSSIPQ